jgi:hypothetical protein
MIRIIAGLLILGGVGFGGYLLGQKKSSPPQPVQQEQPLVDLSLRIPDRAAMPSQEEAVDPLMLKMIQNRFEPLTKLKDDE